ncbi:ABC transporter ATP-binding protein [Rhodococcus rhodnii]|uniref:ABC transporter, ATP-binding component n=2 Tax=Rhodococcus rhodnii TaxID=38312 RepID=R7WJM7_9NOCA|nr:ABC transporter ATP-binding protein [Rhodococcus rhodnii]EOM75521.1 ABC transporter, ATP-binding component [Rhodococcus rhodnii LMG 5362]TXG90472.1 ABC transporter ATP-binding protein [Rhodococcus rhodnii]
MATTLESNTAAITVRDLSITYTRPTGGTVHAVDNISFDVRPGEFLTLIGPSGCGKSSVLRTLGGLQTPSAGDIRLGDVTIDRPVPDRISYVFQDFALFPWRTALANVETPLEIQGVPKKERRERAMKVLEQVGLERFAAQYPHELSGGMKQRVAIARALVTDCDILLMDEPFGALDEQTRLMIGVQLVELLEKLNKTIVFVTHNLQEAVNLSDRVLVFSKPPSVVRDVVEVDLRRPRRFEDMNSEEFMSIQRSLFSLLYETESAERAV